MKRIITLTLLAFVAFPLTQSFAASDAAELTAPNKSTLGFNSSTDVTILYGNDNTGGSPQSYVIMTKHKAGDRVFASTTKTNIMTSGKSDDCKGDEFLAGILNCLGDVGGMTTLTGDAHGNENIDGLAGTGWSLL